MWRDLYPPEHGGTVACTTSANPDDVKFMFYKPETKTFHPAHGIWRNNGHMWKKEGAYNGPAVIAWYSIEPYGSRHEQKVSDTTP